VGDQAQPGGRPPFAATRWIRRRQEEHDRWRHDFGRGPDRDWFRAGVHSPVLVAAGQDGRRRAGAELPQGAGNVAARSIRSSADADVGQAGGMHKYTVKPPAAPSSSRFPTVQRALDNRARSRLDWAWPELSQPGCSACPFWSALDRHDGDAERTVFTPVLQSLILRAWTFQVTQGSWLWRSGSGLRQTPCLGTAARRGCTPSMMTGC